MLTLGYKASAEQFPPSELLGFAVAAERLGFESVAISDHFQPFCHTDGHSPFSLSWLGALAVSTTRVRIGTSVTTPTLRLHPSILAQAFGTLGCLAPGRVFLGVGTGESLNEVPALGIAWPGFKERLGRLEEAVELMRLLWTTERVTFEGRYYRTLRATVYDRPDEPVPILIAAAGPRAARYAGSAGDGFITTSGKASELYTDTLLPAVAEGARSAGRDPDSLERMLEVKVSYGDDEETLRRDTYFWAPLALPGEMKQGVDDPIELERLARENLERAPSRFIVSTDPDEVVGRIAPYVEMGFHHLVFHFPGADQQTSLERFAADVAPRLRARYGGDGVAGQARRSSGSTSRS
jgi:coenzyme F420-dependent glucose-6-phosphate dehydrogenase